MESGVPFERLLHPGSKRCCDIAPTSMWVNVCHGFYVFFFCVNMLYDVVSTNNAYIYINRCIYLCIYTYIYIYTVYIYIYTCKCSWWVLTKLATAITFCGIRYVLWIMQVHATAFWMKAPAALLILLTSVIFPGKQKLKSYRFSENVLSLKYLILRAYHGFQHVKFPLHLPLSRPPHRPRDSRWGYPWLLQIQLMIGGRYYPMIGGDYHNHW